MNDWIIIKNRLVKEFIFKDFMESVEFINQVAEEAELLNHHPTLINTYNKVKVELWTHTVDEITELDYLLKDKIEKINSSLSK
jgi:4a-hydroxytetrahydrobiopterin dehydratase|tara:strand:+ start:3134 stop:3382 length:249 start_codon:yes stop_codon:yes gene_type:complete